MSEIEILKRKIKEKGEFTDEMFEDSFFSLNGDRTVFNDGFGAGDLHGIKLSLSPENLRKLTFGKEAFSDDQIKELGIEEIIEQGKFSRRMKDTQIESENVPSIGIIDSYFKVEGLSEFEGRDVVHITIYRDENGNITSSPEKEVDDNSHGMTTACLATGNTCGVCPKAKLYLFQLANGVTTRPKDVYDYILGYMEKNKIELDVLIDPSFKEFQDGLQKRLDELPGKKCQYFNTAVTWENCAWGRDSNDGSGIVLDDIAKKMSEMSSEKLKEGVADKDMKKKFELAANSDKNVLIPCTGMTSINECFKNEYKYYGSDGGASFPTTILGAIFAVARQINPNIIKNHFFEIMKETAIENSKKQKCLNLKGLIERVKEETENINTHEQEGKDGLIDCIEDDKTRLSGVQNATEIIRDNVLNDNIEHTKDEQNIEEVF